MKKRAAIITAVAIVAALLLVPSQKEIPLRQFVEYRTQSDYSPYAAAIFAQGQMIDAPKLPQDAEIIFYVESNKVYGAMGLQRGARCTDAQKRASYHQDSITMDFRFCPDFNDAILDKIAPIETVPDEAVFIHKQNGERCFVNRDGFAEYFINPASYFFRDYLLRRTAEKLDQFNASAVFLDDLRSWSQARAACGGAPKEYPTQAAYYNDFVELARYMYDNLGAKVYGNLARPGAHWDSFTFLDGAMCESCFTNWGKPLTVTQTKSDLQYMSKWNKKLFIVPMIEGNEEYYFNLSLLIAKPGDYYHFGDNSKYNPLSIYSRKIGSPIADYSCNGTCARRFEGAVIEVILR